MSRILVIGGYGGFGAILCRRLAAGGHHVLVAGRNRDKATRLCSTLSGSTPVLLDRDGDVGERLVNLRPDLVIDAAGPFQGSDYRVANACIALGISYLDLADARDFVTGIATLDGRARTAGVTVVSGASSAPALTGAVARHLAEGLERVDSVDIALSAANRASGGESVVRAILSYVGRPLPLWRGKRFTHGWGWQELRREDFILSSGGSLRGRLVALADLPDNVLLPENLPGRPAVAFRAGTELGFQMRALWLVSWLRRWGLIKSLPARLLLPLYRLTWSLGGLRSAMSITLVGRRGSKRLERRWTILAEKGEGLEVPTLTAALLAEDIIAGRLRPGACDASQLLSLERYDALFAGLAVRHEVSGRTLPPPLYAQVLAGDFDRLPPAVRALHDISRDSAAEGRGHVDRGRNFAARLIGAMMRFPPSGDYPLHVAFREQDGIETWTRDFGGHRFSSRLSRRGPRLAERFGPLRFLFDLPGGPEGLQMNLVGWSLFGFPLPRFLAGSIAAREWEEEGRFRFKVDVALPLVGPVISYAGWLAPVSLDGRAAPEYPADRREVERQCEGAILVD